MPEQNADYVPADDFEAEVVECSLCGEEYSGYGHICDTSAEMRAALRTAMAVWNLICFMAQRAQNDGSGS